jgi:hypothetical protein
MLKKHSKKNIHPRLQGWIMLAWKHFDKKTSLEPNCDHNENSNFDGMNML